MTFSILIASNYFLFFVGFLGMISHFLKKYQANQLKAEIGANINPFSACIAYYLHYDTINTVLTCIAYGVTFAALYQAGTTDLFSVFASGYMADSIFNKAEAKGLTISK